jgi:hypothetical protein
MSEQGIKKFEDERALLIVLIVGLAEVGRTDLV